MCICAHLENYYKKLCLQDTHYALYIGPTSKKDETCPLAMTALSLETIARHGRGQALVDSNGSSTGGNGNGGYGIYFLWPDGAQLGYADR
ncbi:hypothetical protein PoB_005530900 [Plakobranchus ocellatus]|uniref:Uncharacterized protein n=1 Tax=Plakobranchus ocellatus TaxID=259542 RepID=A0AAV4C8B6_9GAST|nr:hypothetical protein PoB_005530900 [Plakobranchus ocellatus]